MSESTQSANGVLSMHVLMVPSLYSPYQT